MTRTKVRIARTAAVLFSTAVVVFGVAFPAHADISSVAVTAPTQNQIISGSYDSDGTPSSAFKIDLKGSANTSCSSGWQMIKFTVTGPASYSQTFNVTPPNSGSWTGAAPSKWDTEALRNGIYTVRLDVTEKDTLALSCNGQSASNYKTVKVANPARKPSWDAAPVASSGGAARVTLQWKKNTEPDVLEYHIVRTGPDGTRIAPVSAGSPGGQGCSVSGTVYTCDDVSFSGNYTGTYTYGVVALRERPAYNSSEEDKIECDTIAKPCVISAGSETHDVSLTAPTPSPTPSTNPTLPPRPTPSASKSAAAGGRSSGGSSGGTRVLSFGSSNDFYSGTYSETLPYQPRTLILGGGSATSSPQASGYDADVVGETPPDYRTIMLPVAGGLLAFLSAAHVRRLLLHL